MKVKMIHGLKIERREEPGLPARILLKVLAVILSFLFSAILFAISGIDPWYAYTLIFVRSFTYSGLAEITTKLIPILLCTVGLIVAFKAGIWNIGAEGQLLLGAVGATWIALFVDVYDPLRLPLALLVGMIFGASWALIPIILKVRLNVNEIVSTLMMNYVASGIVDYLVYGPWKGAREWGFPYTDKFPDTVWLPLIPGTRIHWPTLIFGVFSSIMVYMLFSKTVLGFEMKVCGQGRKIADYLGMPYGSRLMIAMVISGGLVGLAGVGEVCGVHRRLRYASSISSGYGYTAIIGAWLSGLNPLGSIPSAFLLAFLLTGRDIIQVSLGLPFATSNIFNGCILLSMLVVEALGRYRVRWGRWTI
ncbi:MAG: ABC transporter permease [Nitrososphaerota archaeon]|nr:ABC transporter permease [Candidatus Bathyarchaeota archaeon]MCX8162656.1 ABC transporter permease [Candidatus Bathyarchaeota archaeon]MDW8061750.1 ABC transporter permease [Nitrososphaerota archaeon]